MIESLFIESLVNQCSIVLQSGVKYPFFFFLTDSVNQLEILSNSFILRGVVLTFENQRRQWININPYSIMTS